MVRDGEASKKKTGVASWNEEAGISSRAEAAASHTHQSKAQRDRRERVMLLVVLIAICVASVVCFWTPNQTINRGLWLKGGNAITMSASASDGSDPSADELSRAASTLAKRLETAGVEEVHTQAKDANKIEVDVPETADAESLATTLCGAGHVEFVLKDEIGDADALQLIDNGTTGVAIKEGTYTPFMEGMVVDSVTSSEIFSGISMVTVTFDDEAAKTLSDVSSDLGDNGATIVVVVDGNATTTIPLYEQVTNGEVSFYVYEEGVGESLSALFGSEEIPLTLTYEGTEAVGPLVGTSGLWGMVGAAAAVAVAAVIYAFVRYRRLAVLMLCALLTYAVTMLGLMAVMSRADMFTLTLPGVVGGALMGCVVVASVLLICKRFQERVREGGSVRGASLTAVREGLRPLIAPVAIISVVSLVLTLVPNATLSEFGLATIYGVVCGVFAVFWMAVTLLRLLATGTIQAHPSQWGVAANAEEKVADES